ncbi:AMP-binding protein [Motilimonas cestriensis]|uniref:AMP-binding protein n=1 Tax=Motilimonas cestriensis TaxID=2742685 RepID=UPI003DA638FC
MKKRHITALSNSYLRAMEAASQFSKSEKICAKGIQTLLLEKNRDEFQGALQKELARGLESLTNKNITDTDDAFLAKQKLIAEYLLRMTASIDSARALGNEESYLSSLASHNLNAIRVIAPEQNYRCSELVDQAWQLIELFKSNDVKPGSVIAVKGAKSVHKIATLLAIDHLQCVYLPLKSNPTEEETAFILQDSAASFLLEIEVSEFKLECCLPAIPACYDEPGYIIYTSGTTGQPKGIRCYRRSLLNLVHAQILEHSYNSDDTFIWLSDCSFDASLEQLVTALLSGGRLVLAEDPKDLVEVAKRITVNSVNVIDATPSYLVALHPFLSSTKFKTVNAGGEKFHPDILSMYRGDIVNIYGPTETTVSVLKFYPSSLSECDAIGYEINGVEAYIIDKCGTLSFEGELLIGGVCLSAGYIGHAEKLNEGKFIDNPFRFFPGERSNKLYKTGDKVYRKADGSLGYIGRLDRQINYLGRRLELSEVEEHFTGIAGISNAHAFFIEKAEKLGVIYQGQAKVPLQQAATRYNVSILQPLPETPKLDKNGKINFKFYVEQLEAGEAQQHVMGNYAFESLSGLSLPETDMSFIRSGGNSLIAAKLSAHLKGMGISKRISDILKEPSVYNLASAMEAAQSKPDTGSVIAASGIQPINKNALRNLFLRGLHGYVPGSNNIWDMFTIQKSRKSRLMDSIASHALIAPYLRARLVKGSSELVISEYFDWQNFNIQEAQCHEQELVSFIQDLCSNEISDCDGYLWRIGLAEMAEQLVVVVVMDHIISDGAYIHLLKESLRNHVVLEREISINACTGFQGGDCIGTRIAEKGLRPVHVIKHVKPYQLKTRSVSTLVTPIEKELAAKLLTCAKEWGITRFCIMLALFFIFNRVGRQETPAIGTTIARRDSAASLNGVFNSASLAVVAVELVEGDTLRSLAEKVSTRMMHLLDSPKYHFDSGHYQPELVSTVFREQNYADMHQGMDACSEYLLDRLMLTAVQRKGMSTLTDLDLQLYFGHQEAALYCEYSDDADSHFSAYISEFLSFCAETLKTPTEPLKRVDKETQITCSEQGEIIYADGKCTISYNKRTFYGMVELLAQQSEFAPLKAGDVVGIYCDGSILSVAAYLACLSRGLIPLPLESGYPIEFLDSLLTRSQAKLLISANPSMETDRLHMLDLSMLKEAPVKESSLTLKSSGSILLSTSGSTGEPKLVRIPLRQLINLTENFRERLLAGKTARLLHKTPAAFAPSLKEILINIFSDGDLVLAKRSVVRDFSGLMTLVDSCSISDLFIVPSHIQCLLEVIAIQQLEFAGLKRIVTAGEPLLYDDALRLQHALPHVEIWNNYGCTEYNDISYHKFEVGLSQADSGYVAAGRAINYCQLKVLDACDNGTGPVNWRNLCFWYQCTCLYRRRSDSKASRCKLFL